MLPTFPICTYIWFDEAELREIQRDLRTVDMSDERRQILDAMISFFIKTQNVKPDPRGD